MSRKHKLAGTQIGWWNVLIETEPNKRSQAAYRCKCKCGSIKVVLETSLLRGQSKSCGCLRFETGRINITHGATNTAEYRVWAAMKRRCYNPNSRDYHNYGGRGITVSKDWMQFKNFLRDMGKRPSPELTIERKNTNGDYEKDNCRWATWGEQARNRRDSYMLTLSGKTLCVPDWSSETGIPISTIRNRIRLGWTLQETLTTPSFIGKNTR